MDNIQSQAITFIRDIGSDDVVDFGTVLGEFLYDEEDQRRPISDGEALTRAFGVLKYFVNNGEFELGTLDSKSPNGFHVATDSIEEVCQSIQKVVEQEGIRGDFSWLAVLRKKDRK